jgi:hypothetical protein
LDAVNKITIGNDGKRRAIGGREKQIRAQPVFV